MKFIRTMAKYTSQDYKSNEDIWSEMKIKHVLKAIEN